MKRFFTSFALLVVLAITGCGDSETGGVYTGTAAFDNTFRVQFLNVDTAGADTILIQAVDVNGNIVFGPTTIPAAAQFFVDLPGGSNEIQIAFQNNGETFCVYQQQLLETDTQVNDPVCLEVNDFVASIDLTPESATISSSETQNYTLVANLVNGATVDITALVPLTSSVPGVAAVEGGVATGLSGGTTIIGAQVFFFTDSATLVVVQVSGFIRIPGDFEDISETGTEIIIPFGVPGRVLMQSNPMTGDLFPGSDRDDGAGFVELPFAFSLLGDTVNGVWMSTNGYLSTAANDSDPTDFEPVAIPNTNFSEPHNLISPFYTDQTLGFFFPVNAGFQQLPGELGLFFEVRGTAPNRRVIFQWEVEPLDFEGEGPPQIPPRDNIIEQAIEDSSYSYQAKLFESNNLLEFHYRDVTVDFNTSNGPEDALIGVMNNAGTSAATWIFDGTPSENLITDGDALRYIP